MDPQPTERGLAASLELFDRVGVNLDNLQNVVKEMDQLTDISGFVIETSNARYDQLLREFADLASGLPPIDGFSIDVTPISMHDLGQWRIDAIDVPEALPGLGEIIDAPGAAVREYRHRLQRERRRLIRRRAKNSRRKSMPFSRRWRQDTNAGASRSRTMKIGRHSMARFVNCSRYSGTLSSPVAAWATCFVICISVSLGTCTTSRTWTGPM